MKKCCRCKILKEEILFCKNKSRIDGLRTQCKSCDLEDRKKNSEKKRENDIEYRKKNAERLREYSKSYYKANIEQVLKRHLEYKKENLDKEKARAKEWRKNNLHKLAAKSARRRVSKYRGTPAWLTKQHCKEIEKFYIESARLTEQTGVIYEVDHILPLQGKTVSGLHVPWNLQILTQKENQSKGNRY